MENIIFLIGGLLVPLALFAISRAALAEPPLKRVWPWPVLFLVLTALLSATTHLSVKAMVPDVADWGAIAWLYTVPFPIGLGWLLTGLIMAAMRDDQGQAQPLPQHLTRGAQALGASVERA